MIVDPFVWFLLGALFIFPGPFLVVRLLMYLVSSAQPGPERAERAASETGYLLACLIGGFCLLDWFKVGPFLFSNNKGGWIDLGNGFTYMLMALPVPALLQALLAAAMPMRRAH